MNLARRKKHWNAAEEITVEAIPGDFELWLNIAG